MMCLLLVICNLALGKALVVLMQVSYFGSSMACFTLTTSPTHSSASIGSGLRRVRFKMAVLMYKATHGTAPSYLSQLVRVADLPGRRSLRSARANRLLVPPMKLSTVGGRAFPVAGPTIWNSLPDSVISAPSLSTFRQRLKTFLFKASFPDIITDPC